MGSACVTWGMPMQLRLGGIRIMLGRGIGLRSMGRSSRLGKAGGMKRAHVSVI